MFRTPSVTMDNLGGTSVMVRIPSEPQDVLDGDVGNRPATPGDAVQLSHAHVSVIDSHRNFWRPASDASTARQLARQPGRTKVDCSTKRRTG